MITSSFFHKGKLQRDQRSITSAKLPYKVTFIYEPGYKKNVSTERIHSHWVLKRNFHKWLPNTKMHDLVYAAVPIPSIASLAGEYAMKHNMPFIIDVQDIWPEAMKIALDIPIVRDFCFYPLRRAVVKTYAAADVIFAVSDTYLQCASIYNTKAKKRKAVYIGTDLQYFNMNDCKYEITKEADEVWITYIGTLGHSYDIETSIKAMKLVKEKSNLRIKLKILGGGPLADKLKQYADNLHLGEAVSFLGTKEYSEMAAFLKKSDIALNAIRKKAAQSITNKISDYVAAALPILNGSINAEFMYMVEKHELGFNYYPEDPHDLANKILLLSGDKKGRERMGRNAHRLAEELFDRKKTYAQITETIGNYMI